MVHSAPGMYLKLSLFFTEQHYGSLDSFPLLEMSHALRLYLSEPMASFLLCIWLSFGPQRTNLPSLYLGRGGNYFLPHKKSDFLLLFSTQGSLLLEHTLHLLLLLLSIIFFLVVPPGSSFYLQSQAGLRIKHTQNAIESLLCLVSPASPTLTSQMITASSHCILNSAQPGVTCNS